MLFRSFKSKLSHELQTHMTIFFAQPQKTCIMLSIKTCIWTRAIQNDNIHCVMIYETAFSFNYAIANHIVHNDNFGHSGDRLRSSTVYHAGRESA